ncbi:MAG: prolyl oligopeptidase family serine peptidase [Acidobacteria bacterium]|nr:prolyl oligopeptidase family serine peptidase [Acidobacteriota bacterium]
MKRLAVTLALLVWVLVLNPAGAVRDPQAAGDRRAMGLADIVAWKNVGATAISNDGRWLAYRMSPIEGDSDVIVRATDGDKVYTFPVGESPSAAGGPASSGGIGPPPATLRFSEDAKWVAFMVYPTRAESARLRRQRRPIQAKVQLLDLTSSKDLTIENVRRFVYAGERGGWIALQKAPATGGAAGGAAGAAAGAPSGAPAAGAVAGGASDRPKGTDLILHGLTTGLDLNIGNVAEFAFDKSGRWLALIIDAPEKAGNGVQLRDMESGVVTVLDSDKASYERLAWTEKGDGLSVVKGSDDKRYKDKVYAAIGFTGFGAAEPRKTIYDPATDKGFPEGMAISPARGATWAEDLSALLFGIHSLKKADAKPEARPVDPGAEAPAPLAASGAQDDEKVDLVLWHYKDPRLQSQQQVQEETDKNFSFLSVYRVNDKKFIRLADETVRSVNPAPKERFAIGLDVRAYELMSNLDGRRYQDVYVINMQTGERKLALKKAPNMGQPSTDGTKFYYYLDGNYFAYDMASGKSVNLTATVPTSFIDTEDDHNVAKPPRPALGWTKDADAVLLSDGWDIWKVPVAGGAAVNLTVNGKRDGIRYRSILRLDPDERGVDFSVPRYVATFGEYTKKGGVARLDPGKTGVQLLLWDDASFNVQKAGKADVYFYTRSTSKDPADFYVTDASLKPGRKITAVDEQVKAFAWSSGSMLVDYTVTLGKGLPPKKLQGSLFLPANYEKGKTYPTIVYIYEKLTQGHNSFTTPTANGFNKSAYTSNGYAVLQPDITYKVNDPGVSAVACITAALKAAIATGVVDPRHVGLQGHSWGGYQTAFAVTQTDLFAAAIAGAPLTNMVSMYSLIYKNSGSTNQPIFESSQGRFLGGYWDNWEAYVRNSPVNFAKNVKTPLIILHNDKDGAVDFTQGVEYYNTLRRLGKNVIMLEYVGENHGLAKRANQQDYTIRMKEFFDHYLMGKPAPKWMTDGVPRLEMEDHLKERAALKKPPVPEKAKEPVKK